MIADRVVAGCDRCPAVHLVPEAGLGAFCPACGRGTLAAAESRRTSEPERLVRFAVDEATARRRLAEYAEAIWFPTAELSAATLGARLVPVWWPRWLVDADVAGAWEAEVGFDYPVESSQELFEGGSWKTRKVMETRQRWEPRAGRAVRHYDNVAVDGLLAQPMLDARLDPVAADAAVPFDPAALGAAAVRLPDRDEAEMWPAAVEGLRERVGEDCRVAAGAQHLRDLRIELAADRAHWTWLLTPAWATWYADDDGARHLLLVNGVTGRVAGARMASPARGRAVGLVAIATALVLGATGACLGVTGLVIWLLLPVAAVVLLVALGAGCFAIWPFVQPGGWNKAQRAEALSASDPRVVSP